MPGLFTICDDSTRHLSQLKPAVYALLLETDKVCRIVYVTRDGRAALMCLTLQGVYGFNKLGLVVYGFDRMAAYCPS